MSASPPRRVVASEHGGSLTGFFCVLRGPWSGLSMHPVEHLLYFSVVVPHMFVYGHPIHLLFNAQHTGLTPAGGHHGFDGCEGPGPTKYSGSYFHYLHHRYFEVRQSPVHISMPPEPATMLRVTALGSCCSVAPVRITSHCPCARMRAPKMPSNL